MLREILKLIPKIDDAALASMERSLSGRFAKLAKKFGGGLLSVLKGGGVFGAALGIIDKFLNPLKETQEAIDRLLKQGDDIVTNAKQFGTTAGKLFVLQGLAKSTGLDSESLNVLLTKYQAALAEAKADPKKETSVRKYAGDTDIAESFFQFMQELQKIPKQQQVLVQQEVFGEKQILKMSDFLETVGTQAAKQLKLIGAKGSEAYTPTLQKAGDLNDLADALEARRSMEYTLKEGKELNAGMVYSKDRSERKILEQETKRIASYDSLKSMAELSDKIANKMEDMYLFFTKELQGAAGFLSKLTDTVGSLLSTVIDFRNRIDTAFKTSRVFKGIFGGGDK